MDIITLESYKIAVEMYNDEGRAFWGRFNSFILVHSIIILALGTLITNPNCFPYQEDIVPGFIISGMALSLSWGFSTLHGFATLKGYQIIAKDIEIWMKTPPIISGIEGLKLCKILQYRWSVAGIIFIFLFIFSNFR